MFELVESLQPKKLTEENLEMWEIPQSVCYTSQKFTHSCKANTKVHKSNHQHIFCCHFLKRFLIQI